MWHIDNPLKVYKDYYKAKDSINFSLACIMREEKFSSFSKEDRKELLNHNNIKVKNKKIKNPDNPANLLKVKLITLEVS
jgi:hypothetical protein